MITLIVGTNRPGSNTRKVARHLEEIYAGLNVPLRVLDLAQLPPEIFSPAAYGENPPSFQPFAEAVLHASGLHVVTPEQTAWYLGCNTDSVTVLTAAGLLKPLGRPKPNASKFFALAELEVLRADTKWLARATEAIQNWHRNKNDRHCGMRPASSSTGCPGRKVSGTIRSAERFAAPADQTEPANGTHEE